MIEGYVFFTDRHCVRTFATSLLDAACQAKRALRGRIIRVSPWTAASNYARDDGGNLIVIEQPEGRS